MKRSKSCRRRRWSDSDLHRAARAARSMAGTLRALGLRAAGASYENIKRSIKQLSIDTTHWTGKGHLKGTTNPWACKAPITELLKTGTFYQSNKLRKRLITRKIFSLRDALFAGATNGWVKRFHLNLITSMAVARTTPLVTFAYSARIAILARRRIGVVT